MSIRHLRTLIAVSEHGSFAAAAEVICLTQSAISQQIKTLEEQFGVELFDRRKRPPELNAHGRALIQRARQLVYLYDQLHEGAGRQSELEGLLEIGAVPTTLTGIVPRALVRLRASQPTLQVRVSSGLSAELLARLDRGDLDAAVVSEPKPVPTGMLWHPASEEPLMVIAPHDAPGEDYRELLTSLPFIRFSRNAWVGQAIQSRLQDLGLQVRETMELNSLEAIRQMVRHGLGVSIVPVPAVTSEDNTGIRMLTFGVSAQYRVIGLLERQEHLKTGLTAALLQELIAAAS